MQMPKFQTGWTVSERKQQLNSKAPSKPPLAATDQMKTLIPKDRHLEKLTKANKL